MPSEYATRAIRQQAAAQLALGSALQAKYDVYMPIY